MCWSPIEIKYRRSKVNKNKNYTALKNLNASLQISTIAHTGLIIVIKQ